MYKINQIETSIDLFCYKNKTVLLLFQKKKYSLIANYKEKGQ